MIHFSVCSRVYCITSPDCLAVADAHVGSDREASVQPLMGLYVMVPGSKVDSVYDSRAWHDNDISP